MKPEQDFEPSYLEKISVASQAVLSSIYRTGSDFSLVKKVEYRLGILKPMLSKQFGDQPELENEKISLSEQQDSSTRILPQGRYSARTSGLTGDIIADKGLVRTLK